MITQTKYLEKVAARKRAAAAAGAIGTCSRDYRSQILLTRWVKIAQESSSSWLARVLLTWGLQVHWFQESSSSGLCCIRPLVFNPILQSTCEPHSLTAKSPPCRPIWPPTQRRQRRRRRPRMLPRHPQEMALPPPGMAAVLRKKATPHPPLQEKKAKRGPMRRSSCGQRAPL